MIKIDFVDRANFSSPLAGASTHLTGNVGDPTRPLNWTLFVTADPIQADEGYHLQKPNVTWTWRQYNVDKLHAQANGKRDIDIPVGESQLINDVFDPIIDTKILPDGIYQVTATLRDGTIPLASFTRMLRIEGTNLHDHSATDPTSLPVGTDRLAKVEAWVLETKNKQAKQDLALVALKNAVKGLVADPALAVKLDTAIPDIRP